jgi:hypothetical protein
MNKFASSQYIKGMTRRMCQNKNMPVFGWALLRPGWRRNVMFSTHNKTFALVGQWHFSMSSHVETCNLNKPILEKFPDQNLDVFTFFEEQNDCF